MRCHVASWHKADVLRQSSDVRCSGLNKPKSGPACSSTTERPLIQQSANSVRDHFDVPNAQRVRCRSLMMVSARVHGRQQPRGRFTGYERRLATFADALHRARRLPAKLRDAADVDASMRMRRRSSSAPRAHRRESLRHSHSLHRRFAGVVHK